MALPSSSSSSSEPESEKEKLLSKDEISSWEDKPRHIFWDKEQEEEYKPNEIISILGFGTAQVIACIVVGLAFVSGFCAVQLQPFLSARLYVEMQLTPTQESILSAVSLSGLIVASFPFGLLCDVIGRKKSLMLACFLMLVWNLLTCAAPNFGWLVFFRLLVSISRGKVQIRRNIAKIMNFFEGRFVQRDRWRDNREVRYVVHTAMIERSIPCLREAVCVRMSSYLTIASG